MSDDGDEYTSFLNGSNLPEQTNFQNKTKYNLPLQEFATNISPSKPFLNTRSSNKAPSYSQGIPPPTRPRKAKIDLPQTNSNRSFLDEKIESKNKYKNKNANSNKSSKPNTPKLSGNGLWKTKRFF